MPVKFQSNANIITFKLVAPILHDILRLIE